MSDRNPHNKFTKIMMTNAEVINIVETAVKAFNRKQLKTESIQETSTKRTNTLGMTVVQNSQLPSTNAKKDCMYEPNLYPTALDPDEV
jgi:hypothetical protein